MESISDIIEALGGARRTGEIVGVGITAIGQWKARGYIPPQHYFTISKALADLKKPAPSPSLFSKEGVAA